MLKILGGLGLLVAAAVAVLVVLALRMPDAFSVERQTLVQAAPERVFAQINDLERMRTWNPWERKDPSVRGSHGALRSGVGASYAWTSDQVGAGSMTITESTPPSRVVLRLDFLQPFAATNRAEYTLTPEGGGTRVRWVMSGPSPFLSKVMQVVLDFDQMIGRDFEAGLAALKAQAEAR
jgi:uncharacterized protein YndB with AHSA1/START domain